MLEACSFFLGKRSEHLAANAVSAHDSEGRQTYVFNAVLAVHHGGYGHSGFRTVEDVLYDVAGGDCNRVVGHALARDDLTAGLANVLFYIVVIQRRLIGLVILQASLVGVNVYVGNVSKRPRYEGRIAVLAVYVCVYVCFVDVVVFCQIRAQTSGIQGSAGADDVVLGQAGILAELIGDNVNGVTDYNINCVGSSIMSTL